MTLPRDSRGYPEIACMTTDQARQLHIRNYDILHRLRNAIAADRWELLHGVSKADICYAVDQAQGLVEINYEEHWPGVPFPDRYDAQDNELPVWEVK